MLIILGICFGVMLLLGLGRIGWLGLFVEVYVLVIEWYFLVEKLKWLLMLGKIEIFVFIRCVRVLNIMVWLKFVFLLSIYVLRKDG